MYYAVKVGVVPGIYESWEECEKQVKGFSGAVYKKFKSLDDAKAFMGAIKEENGAAATDDADAVDIYVDGSYDVDTGRYAWAFVVMHNNTELHSEYGVGSHEEAAAMRNVAGELAAAMRAVLYAKRVGYKTVRIIHDYEGVGAWVSGKWRAKNNFVKQYVEFMQKHGHNVEFVKCDGHSGVAGNERADKLARNALLQFKKMGGVNNVQS